MLLWRGAVIRPATLEINRLNLRRSAVWRIAIFCTSQRRLLTGHCMYNTYTYALVAAMVRCKCAKEIVRVFNAVCTHIYEGKASEEKKDASFSD